MAEVRWTVRALRDYQTIFESIEESSPSYAAAFSHRLNTSIERLETFPGLGRVVPEYESESIRELLVDMYRVVYRLEDEGPLLIAIRYASPDLLRGLGTAPWDIRLVHA